MINNWFFKGALFGIRSCFVFCFLCFQNLSKKELKWITLYLFLFFCFLFSFFFFFFFTPKLRNQRHRVYSRNELSWNNIHPCKQEQYKLTRLTGTSVHSVFFFFFFFWGIFFLGFFQENVWRIGETFRFFFFERIFSRKCLVWMRDVTTHTRKKKE